MVKRMVRKADNEDKVLKGVENIVILMREQYGSLRGEIVGVKGEIGGIRGEVVAIKEEIVDMKSDIKKQYENSNIRFNRLENAVMETSLDVKTIGFRLEKTEQKIDLAVTNHESRIRRLEEKSGV